MLNSDRIDPNVPGLDHAFAFGDARLPGNQQAGVAYTAELADLEKAIRFTGSSPAVLTIPPQSACPFPSDALLTVARDGTGSVAIAAGAGVTINRPAGAPATIAGQGQLASLRRTGLNVWFLSGGLG